MRRRDFIIGGTAASWSLATHAQQPGRLRRIGVLMGYAEGDADAQSWYAAFREGLQKLGWTEGHNTQIDTRWAAPDDAESMRRFAKELVALQPDLLLSSTTPTTSALLQQTRTIPIVFAIVADPIGSGFVANFARPGGNVTGFIFTEPTMVGKWLELLKKIAPRIDRVAMLFNPTSATYADYWLKPFKAAAPSFAVEAIVAPLRDRTGAGAQVHDRAWCRADHSTLLQSDDRRSNAVQAIEKCRCLYWIDESTPCVWRDGLVRPNLEVWRHHAPQLSFRSGRGTADPRAEMVGAEGLGDEACQAQWA
jgi:hypothetical protein